MTTPPDRPRPHSPGLPTPTGAGGSGEPGPNRSRRRWLLSGGVLATVVVAGAALAVSQGDDGNGGSGCVTGLVDHLPPDEFVVQGSDLARARQAGYHDNGGIEQLGDSALATGVSPDPLTTRRLRSFDESSDRVGFDPDQVECWLGPVDQGFVARGTFDTERTDRSELAEDGSLELDAGLLAHSPDRDAGEFLATRAQPATLRNLVEAFERHGAISFSGTTAGDDPAAPWVGVALARGDDWELLVVWALPDADAAGDAQSHVLEVLRTDSQLGDTVEGDPADGLRRDGATLWLRAPLSDDPTSWLTPLQNFDPGVFVFSDSGDQD